MSAMSVESSMLYPDIQDIIENPVDDFVARFVGVENGRRTLSANPRPAGGWSINDSTGRPLGIISQLPRERQG